MSIADWTGRLTTVGGTANEVAAITSAYYADPQPVQAALDTLVNTLSNAGLLAMLNTWRTSGGPFAAGFPSGGLPFGTGVAVLTGNSADDAYPIGAGTGAKMTSIPAGDIPPHRRGHRSDLPEGHHAVGCVWCSGGRSLPRLRGLVHGRRVARREHPASVGAEHGDR